MPRYPRWSLFLGFSNEICAHFRLHIHATRTAHFIILDLIILTDGIGPTICRTIHSSLIVGLFGFSLEIHFEAKFTCKVSGLYWLFATRTIDPMFYTTCFICGTVAFFCYVSDVKE
jgi:hypothetical protein